MKEPVVGSKYWWLSHTHKGPVTLEVTGITNGGDIYFLAIGHKWCGWRAVGPSGAVVWTTKEWESAKRTGSLRDYVPPVRKEQLGQNEELCFSCHGTLWEDTQDGDVCFCIWCDGTGKRTKPPLKQFATYSRRSHLHPEVRDDNG